MFLDPSSPITTYGISDNGTENVSTETLSASLTSAPSDEAGQSLSRTVFARLAVVAEQLEPAPDKNSRNY